MQGDSADTNSTIQAPDWSTIPREILCPLCGYNLRGLIEPRCPECGHRSTWEVLLAEEVVHPYLFEHQPERKARSWRRTLWTSVRRPGRFWRELLPVHRIRPVRIGLYWIGIVIVGALAMLPVVPMDAVYRIARQNGARERMRAYMESDPQNAPAVMGNFPTTQAYLNATYPRRSFLEATWDSVWYQGAIWGTVRLSFMATVLWPIVTFAALMIYRASMARARIRTGHVVRCVVYSVDPFLVPVCALCFLLVFWVGVAPLSPVVLLRIHPSFLVVALVHGVMAYRLMMAYQRYLAFPHALAAVIASQIIVLLGLWKISLVLSGY